MLQLLGTDLDGVRKQQAATKAKIDRLTPQLNALNAQIEKLGDELKAVKDKKEVAIATVQQLRKKRDAGVCFLFLRFCMLSIFQKCYKQFLELCCLLLGEFWYWIVIPACLHICLASR